MQRLMKRSQNRPGESGMATVSAGLLEADAAGGVSPLSSSSMPGKIRSVHEWLRAEMAYYACL